MSTEHDVLDGITIGITLLTVLMKAYPEFASWIRDVTEGRVDPISVRVRDILPEQSASSKAVTELGRVVAIGD